MRHAKALNLRFYLANDPKLSDRGVRRGTCMVGGKAAAGAGAVTHGAVRCSAWLAVAVVVLRRFVIRGLGKESKVKLVMRATADEVL